MNTISVETPVITQDHRRMTINTITEKDKITKLLITVYKIDPITQFHLPILSTTDSKEATSVFNSIKPTDVYENQEKNPSINI